MYIALFVTPTEEHSLFLNPLRQCMTTLPLELVSEVIQKALELELPAADYDIIGITSKAPWSSVSPLSLSCKSYRLLVLKAWFYRLYTEYHDDTTNLTNRIPLVKKSWVKCDVFTPHLVRFR